MKVVYTPAHMGHNPHAEIAASRSASPFEHIGRAEAIKETLINDSSMEFLSPTQLMQCTHQGSTNF
jgi:hypothetical protein